MPKQLPVIAMIALGVANAGCSSSKDASITQEELVRRTQELVDSVATGDRKVWDRYFAEDSMDHDKNGHSMDKKALLADITPPPPNWSGSITLEHPESRISDNAAILSYDLAETEVLFGQTVHARYHTTDTWLRRNGTWQIVAEQALRYYEDPAVGAPQTTKYPDYTGVYQVMPNEIIEVSNDGTELFSRRSGKSKELLLPEAGDLFFRKGVEGRRLFRRDMQGKVDALIDRRNNEDIVWPKVQ